MEYPIIILYSNSHILKLMDRYWQDYVNSTVENDSTMAFFTQPSSHTTKTHRAIGNDQSSGLIYATGT